jgi:hypothetical protein
MEVSALQGANTKLLLLIIKFCFQRRKMLRHTRSVLFIAVAPCGDKSSKYQVDRFLYTWNLTWLRSDCTGVGIDRFMHFTVYGLPAATRQIR